MDKEPAPAVDIERSPLLSPASNDAKAIAMDDLSLDGGNGLTRQSGGKCNCDVNKAKANRHGLTAEGYSKLVSDLAHQTVLKNRSAAGFPTRAAFPV